MRSRILLACLALLAAPLAGCAAPSGPAPPTGEISFETIERGDNSAIEERGAVAIRTLDTWSDLWTAHKANEEGDPGVPNVNFSESIVIAVFKGQSPSGCHGTEVTNVTGQPNGTILVEAEHYEVTGAVCTEQITHPYHIVQIDRYGGEVVFDVRETTRPAGNGEGQPDDGSPPDPDDDPGPGDQGSYTCRKRSDATPAQANATGNASFTSIDQGSQSGLEEVCLTVARNQTAWRDLWTAHQSRRSDPDPRPQIDFSQRMVVAIFKGQSPDGCHGAEIERLSVNGSTLVVHGAFLVIESAACTQAVTYPFHIVETDRHEGTVRFDVGNQTRQV